MVIGVVLSIIFAFNVFFYFAFFAIILAKSFLNTDTKNTVYRYFNCRMRIYSCLFLWGAGAALVPASASIFLANEILTLAIICLTTVGAFMLATSVYEAWQNGRGGGGGGSDDDEPDDGGPDIPWCDFDDLRSSWEQTTACF